MSAVHSGADSLDPAIAAPCASLPGLVEETQVQESDTGSQTDGWIVTVYDNDRNTYEEVMAILMIATHCTADEAYIEAWEIDHLGKSVVHSGSKDVCSVVAEIIGTIGIRVEVSRD